MSEKEKTDAELAWQLIWYARHCKQWLQPVDVHPRHIVECMEEAAERLRTMDQDKEPDMPEPKPEPSERKSKKEHAEWLRFYAGAQTVGTIRQKIEHAADALEAAPDWCYEPTEPGQYTHYGRNTGKYYGITEKRSSRDTKWHATDHIYYGPLPVKYEPPEEPEDSEAETEPLDVERLRRSLITARRCIGNYEVFYVRLYIDEALSILDGAKDGEEK